MEPPLFLQSTTDCHIIVWHMTVVNTKGGIYAGLAHMILEAKKSHDTIIDKLGNQENNFHSSVPDQKPGNLGLLLQGQKKMNRPIPKEVSREIALFLTLCSI